MKIAVHYTDGLHDASFSFGWIKELQKRGVDVLKTDLRRTDVVKQIEDCDGVMWNWFHLPLDKISAPHILYTIEHVLQIPVFPNVQTRWHFDEKIAQHHFFKAQNLPSIKSWVFFSYEEAIEFINNSEFPLVFKLSVGASSSNVIKVNNKQEAINITNRIFGEGIEPNKDDLHKYKNGNLKSNLRINLNWLKSSNNKINYPLIQKEYVYFQEFLPDNKYDIRVNVIGKRAFAFIRYNRTNDFRASGSGLIDYNKEYIPLDVIKLALKISTENKFQAMAYDFLKDKNGNHLINEISYSFRSDPVTNCNGYWDEYLNFIERRISPEEAEVEDFIEYINSLKK